MPNLAEYQHQDETDLDRHDWTPLDYFEQYIDRDLISEMNSLKSRVMQTTRLHLCCVTCQCSCANKVSLSHIGNGSDFEDVYMYTL